MFRGGERVRVPSPEADGTVEAVYVAPSEPSRRHARFVWVRYLEGPEEGANARVPYSEVKATSHRSKGDALKAVGLEE
jgi:hypothetical protein